MSPEENRAFNEGFNEEFIKLAQGASFLQLLLKGMKGIGSKLKLSGKLERFATDALGKLDANGRPTAAFKNYMKKSGPTSFTKNPDGTISARVGNDSGFLGSRFAEAYNYKNAITKGVKSQKGFVAKTKKVLTNLKDAEVQQYRDASYRIVDPNKPSMFGFSKHRVVDGKLKGQGPFWDRPIKGTTAKGEVIVGHRLPVKLLKYSFIPTGVFASGVLTGGGVKDSAKDAALWSPLTRILGEGKMLIDSAQMAANAFS